MHKERANEEVITIPCKVALGTFSSERTVAVDLPDGREVYTIVDESLVEVDQKLGPDVILNGRVKVSLVEIQKDSAVVDLPGEGLSNGTRLIIPKALLTAESR